MINFANNSNQVIVLHDHYPNIEVHPSESVNLNEYWSRHDIINESPQLDSLALLADYTLEYTEDDLTYYKNQFKQSIFPASPNVKYTISENGLDVIINIVSIVSNDITTIIPDSTETKYILFSVVYNEALESIYIIAREKTDGIYSDLEQDEYLIQNLKEYSILANGTNLIDTGAY